MVGVVVGWARWLGQFRFFEQKDLRSCYKRIIGIFDQRFLPTKLTRYARQTFLCHRVVSWRSDNKHLKTQPLAPNSSSKSSSKSCFQSCFQSSSKSCFQIVFPNRVINRVRLFKTFSISLYKYTNIRSHTTLLETSL